MIHLFTKPHKQIQDKPIYLDRIDTLKKLEIVRFKGRLDKTTIPIVESRIKENRKKGSKIDKNVVLDFSKVEHVDSALVATHVMHLNEYQSKGYTIAFINVTDEFKVLVDIFKEKDLFRIFASEAEAVKELNR